MPIRMGMDVSEAMAAIGFLEEVSLQIGTPQYIGPVLKFVHAEMSREFNHHMDTLAPTHPEKFHHVYEWGEIGEPNSRLWNNVLVGGGNTRLATWEWRASKTIVPVVNADAAEVGVKAIHIFTWKAPVMEYEMNLVIHPKRGSMLVFFTGPPGPRTGDTLTVYKSGESRTVEYPGGEAVKGAFTDEYISWWNGAGFASAFSGRIRGILEGDLAKMPLQSTSGMFRTGTRSRSKNVGLAVLADAEAAKKAGKAKAAEWLSKRSRNYIDAAAARGEFLGE